MRVCVHACMPVCVHMYVPIDHMIRLSKSKKLSAQSTQTVLDTCKRAAILFDVNQLHSACKYQAMEILIPDDLF